MTMAALRERLIIQENAWPTVSITSLTSSGTTATATTDVPHGYRANDYVTVADASPSGYNGKVKVLAVADGVTFTYAVTAGLTTPATGTITVVYTCGPQGERRSFWATVETVYAERVPIRAFERLQRAAVQSSTLYRFRVRTRSDVTPTMRILWTPTWPTGASRQTLEISGVLPDDRDRAYMVIDAAEAA